MEFSKRVKCGAFNPLAAAAHTLKEQGQDLVDLANSNPTRHGLGLAELPVYTADPQGNLSDREKLAQFLSKRDGREVNPNRLYLLSSTSQAYAWILKLLCNPNDTVLNPAPGYPLIETLAKLESVQTRNYHMVHLGKIWEIDFSAFTQIKTPDRLKALICINPNNPTGSYLHDYERSKLVNYCLTHRLALIADEVFYDYALPAAPANRARLAGTPHCLTFALDGLSKSLGAPGAKLAWIEISGPEDLVKTAQERLDTIADAYLPVSDVLSQNLVNWLEAIPQQTQNIRKRCQENLKQAKTLVDQEPSGTIEIVEPEGGWSTLLRIPGHLDEDQLLTTLLARRGISVQPGYFFDIDTSGYLNVSLLLKPDIFAEAFKTTLTTIGNLL